MKSRIALITVLTAALSAGGLMAKEDASAHHRQAGAHFLNRMSTALNLTAQQQEQAKAIFQSERAASHSVRQRLLQQRKDVRAAIQAGKPATEVAQLAKNEGPALGDLAGMRAAASAQFRALLTPEQQQKLVTLRQQWREHRGNARRSGAVPGNIQTPGSR